MRRGRLRKLWLLEDFTDSSLSLFTVSAPQDPGIQQLLEAKNARKIYHQFEVVR